MKKKAKPHSKVQRNNFHVDFTDYPQKQPEQVESRAQKRFFTSKHEEIDKHDNISACLSIEKELPELAIRPRASHSTDDNVAITHLVNETKLKEEALAKATKMITLLREENADLNAQIQQLQFMLVQKDGLIESLENQLRFSTCDGRDREKDAMTERNRHTVQVQYSRQRRSLKQERIRSKNQLFFGFTHSKKKECEVKMSQNTIFLPENPTFKSIKDLNISKKLTPYTSKNDTKNITQNGQNPLKISYTEEIWRLLLQEQAQSSKYLFNELTELLETEGQNLLSFQSDFQKIQRQIIEQYDQQTSNNCYQSVQSKTEIPITSTELITSSYILQEYEQLIYHYREYAAFLKSYLCESLNFMYSVSYNLPSHSLSDSFGQLVKKVAKEMSKVANSRTKTLCLQNKELKNIIQQLIKNIEVTRKKQLSFHSKE